MSNSKISRLFKAQPHPDKIFKLAFRDGFDPADLQSDSNEEILHAAFTDQSPEKHKRTLKFLAEGDSWVNIFHGVPGQPMTFVDVLGSKMSGFGFEVSNIGWPGDTLSNMVITKQYKVGLQSGIHDYFIFSGGGVDFFVNLKFYVHKFEEVGEQKPPSAYIKEVEFDNFLDVSSYHLDSISKEVKVWTGKDTKVIFHGYDYARPEPDGIFLGRRFEALGYNGKTYLQRNIVKKMIDKYYDMLLDLEKKLKNSVIVDFRNKIGNEWNDEIHANSKGARKLAGHFLETLGLK